MIQRIQSLHFLLAALILGISTQLDLALFACSKAGTQATLHLTAMGVHADGALQYTSPGFFHTILAFAILATILPLIAIFLYKQRRLQMRLALYSIAFTIVYGAGVGFEIYTIEGSLINQQYTVDFSPTFSLILPILGIIFATLAYRGVRKDDSLIRSVDRIR